MSDVAAYLRAISLTSINSDFTMCQEFQIYHLIQKHLTITPWDGLHQIHRVRGVGSLPSSSEYFATLGPDPKGARPSRPEGLVEAPCRRRPGTDRPKHAPASYIRAPGCCPARPFPEGLPPTAGALGVLARRIKTGLRRITKQTRSNCLDQPLEQSRIMPSFSAEKRRNRSLEVCRKTKAACDTRSLARWRRAPGPSRKWSL